MATAPSTLPDEAFALALAALPGMGPRRLTRLVTRWGPAEAWHQVTLGRAMDDIELATVAGPDPGALAQRWVVEAERHDVAERWAHCCALDVQVSIVGRAGYPSLLAHDPEPPAVLFATGDLEALSDHPRAAVVGMRNATGYGLSVARRLGAELAEEGVVVVSGLAIGIDGAAHRGALEAAGPVAPVAVVASGHDVIYPRRHAALWREVAGRGVLVSEVPPGGRPDPWRFPARNRVIAALAQVVVVVESQTRGGSMYTVEEAQVRDRTVMAVPGAVDSPASTGTNGLLADGAVVVRDTDDVLAAVGRNPRRARGQRALALDVAPLEPGDRRLLEQLRGAPLTIAELAERSGRGLLEVAASLARLQQAQRVVQRGQWVEVARARGAR